MTEKLCERLEMQEGSSSLLASTSDSAAMIPDNFILLSCFMLLWISCEMAKCSFRRCRVVRETQLATVKCYCLTLYMYEDGAGEEAYKESTKRYPAFR